MSTFCLQRKVVSTQEDGTSNEWRLIPVNDNDPEGDNVWKPVVVNADGEVIREPVWLPLPGSQYLFLECPIFEALFEGTRGPGKTITLLMDFAKEVGKGYGNAWRGILFRRQFGDLDDVVKKIEEWFPRIFPGFRFLKSKSEYMGVWPTGEALLLRHLNNEDDYDEYHGHEYPWIGFEELTQWDNDKAYKLMQSCCRSSKPGMPCRVRATTNPYGIGHGWVKKRFRLPEMRGRVIRMPGEMPRVAIHGTLTENFLLLHASPMYAMQIKNAAKNPAQAEAWLRGDWNVTSGGMIDDLWDPKRHIVPSFGAGKIPLGWRIHRAYDHGSSAPFAVGWWLESNGEPIEVDGRIIGEVRGDVILWMEWYGTAAHPSEGSQNEGLRMSSAKIAAGIRDLEEDEDVWGRVEPGPADDQIFGKQSDRNGRSPADDFDDAGIHWERADKSQGSRKRGWQMLRTYLENAIPVNGYREKPGVFICERCIWWIELVPPMPRDEKDLDEVPDTYEDHHADQTRYRLNWDPPGMWRKGF